MKGSGKSLVCASTRCQNEPSQMSLEPYHPESCIKLSPRRIGAATGLSPRSVISALGALCGKNLIALHRSGRRSGQLQRGEHGGQVKTERGYSPAPCGTNVHPWAYHFAHPGSDGSFVDSAAWVGHSYCRQLRVFPVEISRGLGKEGLPGIGWQGGNRVQVSAWRLPPRGGWSRAASRRAVFWRVVSFTQRDDLFALEPGRILRNLDRPQQAL